MINKAYTFYKKNIKKHIPRGVFKRFNVLFAFFSQLIQQYNYQDEYLNLIGKQNLKSQVLDIQSSAISSLSKIIFSETSKPTASIIIPIFNQWHYTYFCLQSLAKLKSKTSFEILIIDNCSTDKTTELFQSDRIKNAKYFKQTNNFGFGEACNIGAGLAKGEFLVFLNNDTYVLDGWLDNLIKLFHDQKNVGLIGSKLIYPDGQLQEAGGIVWKNRNAHNYGRFDNPENFKYNYLKEVDYCSGASIIIRKNLFNKLGGFDKLFAPAYYEDTDLAFKVRAAGYRVLYQPASELVHFEGATAGKNTNSGFKAYQQINQEKFFTRWNEIINHENQNETDGQFLARDRSQNKKHILYIDNNVPTINHDAGSYITFQYLTILNDLGYKVVFWPINMQKISPETEHLQQLGVEVVYGNENLEEYLKQCGKYFEHVFIARPNVAEQCLEVVKQNTQAKILYMAHDLHFQRQLQLENQSNGDHLLSNRIKELERTIMSRIDISLVFNEKEKAFIEKEFAPARAATIPWIQKIENQHQTPCDGFVFLGGFNHPPNIEAVLWLYHDIWPLIKKSLPTATIDIVGHNPPPEILALNSDDFKVSGYKENLKSSLLNKVFLCPLITGAGFKGKIAMAMAHGCPIITTNIGASGIGLIDQESAIITDNPQIFAQQAVILMSNFQKQQYLSNKARQLLLEKYSVNAATKIIDELLGN